MSWGIYNFTSYAYFCQKITAVRTRDYYCFVIFYRLINAVLIPLKDIFRTVNKISLNIYHYQFYSKLDQLADKPHMVRVIVCNYQKLYFVYAYMSTLDRPKKSW